MKNLLLFIMFSYTTISFGQVSNFADIPKALLENIGNLGINDSLLLNTQESIYFNCIFEKSRNDFDFTEKKIAFLTGSSGNDKSTKRDYFNLEKYQYVHNFPPNSGELYVFNEEQKEKSGGYDAAIVYWCKVIMTKEKVVERLRRK
ncbi:MAG: hypothetical protein KBT20_10860 [Bacteroidales bacterium]|nr:hypothetical protein [Candidatus Liminaster caballi]